jgi:hypothetical protein
MRILSGLSMLNLAAEGIPPAPASLSLDLLELIFSRNWGKIGSRLAAPFRLTTLPYFCTSAMVTSVDFICC